MCWNRYIQHLLAAIEENLRAGAGAGAHDGDDDANNPVSTSHEPIAGSHAWLAQLLEQSFSPPPVQDARFCVRKAKCFTQLPQSDSSDVIEIALENILAVQLQRFSALFERDPAVASLSLTMHVQGIGSSGIFVHAAETCRWLYDCLLPRLRDAA